jgi:F0F1-type ATP synthase assembly protein I
MPREDDESSQVEAAQASLQLAFTIIIQIAVLSMVIIMGALVGGLVLDRLLATKPLFTILLVFASFPISLYAIYRAALRAVSRIQPPKKAARKGGPEQ